LRKRQLQVRHGVISQHDIDLKTDRGEPYAAYVIVRFKDGTEKIEVMGKEEIYEIRNMSSGYNYAAKKGFDSPWISKPKDKIGRSEREMWKKTVFRSCTKWLPLTPEIKEKLDKDPDAKLYTGLPTKMASEVQTTSPIEDGSMVEDMKPESAAEEKPQTQEELTPVEGLSKAACLAELKAHEGTPYFAGILDETVAPDLDYKACAVSTLRDMVKAVREATKAE